MTDLNAIVSIFSLEEQQQFILFLEKKNKRKDTKNITLFKLLVKNDLSSNDICKTIYKENKKQAYHALRKRLYQSIIDFVATTNLEDEHSIDMQLIKYILAARTFLLHHQYALAYAVLDKAEALAQEHFLFSILNEIYHTKIQYAYAYQKADLQVLEEQFKTNQKDHYLEDQLNLVYAKMRQALSHSHYKGDTVAFETLLQKTLTEHKISLQDSMSFKSLYQLITLVSLSAFVTNDYLKIEGFLISTYNRLKTLNNQDRQLYYHIQVLYLIANTLFRNKKFKASKEYLEVMHNYMLLKRKKYYKAFVLKHNLLLALNANYTNKQVEAISILEQNNIIKHDDIETILDCQLSLIMFYIQAVQYKKAQAVFASFYHTDTYYESKAGKEWVIKKNLIEIILHIELKNIDLVDSRLLSFKRHYYKHLKSINQQRVITYLNFVETYYKDSEQTITLNFKNKIRESFEWIGSKKEDIFVMSFYAWLKSKMENQPLYNTTLDLILQAQKE